MSFLCLLSLSSLSGLARPGLDRPGVSLSLGGEDDDGEHDDDDDGGEVDGLKTASEVLLPHMVRLLVLVLKVVLFLLLSIDFFVDGVVLFGFRLFGRSG